MGIGEVAFRAPLSVVKDIRTVEIFGQVGLGPSGLASCCGFEVLLAALLDCFSFDLTSFMENGLSAPEVDVGGCEVVQALVVAAMILVLQIVGGPFSI